MKAGVGKFIFSEASCAYHQAIPFKFYPDDHKRPGKLTRNVSALRAQRFNAKDAAFMHRAPDGESAAQITDVFHARSFRELQPRFIHTGNFHLRMQEKTAMGTAFVDHLASCFGPPSSGWGFRLVSFSPCSNRAPIVEPCSFRATHMTS